jgi:transglutaminase-like putative cysteine protease
MKRLSIIVALSILAGWGVFTLLLCAQGEPLASAWLPSRSGRIARRVDARFPLILVWAAAIRAQTSNPLLQAALAQKLVALKIPYTASSTIAGVEKIPSVSEVLADGSGNCEAQTIVLASLWRALGLSCQIQSRADHCWAVLSFDSLKNSNALPTYAISN